MAKKKILQDKDGQLWPITVADCVYLTDGSKTLKEHIDDGLAGKANSSHGNHVPTTQTANNAKFLRNDNTWQTVTPANIGAAARQYKTAATAATAGWYRIASSPSGINRNIGSFQIDATVSGKHSVSIINAGICYGQTPTLQQISHTEHSNTGISKVRIVYHTTYSGNYAYLEVYVPTATATTLNVKLVEGFGWTLTAPNTAGSIPSGYTSKEITLAKNKMVTDISGSASKWATARTLSWTGDATGSMSVNGSENKSAELTLANSGVTAGNYGPSANASPAHAGTFSVPYITVDAKGRVTAASTKTITLPSDNNTDTKVTYTLATTTKYYMGGPTATATGTGGITFDTGIFATTTAGQLQVNGGLISGSTVRSDTAVADNLGTNSVPWASTYSKHYYINNDGAGINYGRFFCHTPGTTSAVGNGRITLGNSTASGTANNAQGSICLYGSDVGYTIINPGYNSTGNITLTLPASTGTIARTADNVASATKLKTARDITIGNKTNSFNGTAAISYSLADIGAAPTSHTHDYLPLTGGVLTGRLHANGKISTYTRGGSWIDAVNFDNVAIVSNTEPDNGSYFPLIAVRTEGMHTMSIGSNYTNFGFYGFKNGRTENGVDLQFSLDVANHTLYTNAWSTFDNGMDVTGTVNAGTLRPKYAVGAENCYIGGGNGDNATWETHNMVIRSHWGIGFRDYQDICRTVLDTRTGTFSTMGNVYSGNTVSCETGFYTNGYLSCAGDLSVAARSWLTSVTVNDKFIGETKFTIDGVYNDPWENQGCAIKAQGNIACNGTMKSGAVGTGYIEGSNIYLYGWPGQYGSHFQCNTQGDGNGYGDGQTHIGYNTGNGYAHYFRGTGAFNIDNTGGVIISSNCVHIGGIPFTISSYAPGNGGVWIQW